MCKHNIIVTDAPSIRLPFPSSKVHIDELSYTRFWQHELCATLSANVDINYHHSHQGILPYLYF